MPRSLAALAFVALLAACASSQLSPAPQPSATLLPSPTIAPTATTSPTATATSKAVPPTIPQPTGFAMDCISFADIYAWHDLDEDGQQGAHEPPLPGATTVITGFGSKTVTTDATGEAHYSVLYACPWRDFVAIATPPPGYRLTTPDRLAVPFRTSATPKFVRFGFVKDAP